MVKHSDCALLRIIIRHFLERSKVKMMNFIYPRWKLNDGFSPTYRDCSHQGLEPQEAFLVAPVPWTRYIFVEGSLLRIGIDAEKPHNARKVGELILDRRASYCPSIYRLKRTA